MFAIVQDGQLKYSDSLKTLFPNVSFPRSGSTTQFRQDNGVMEVVDGERKDERFYWVTPANPAIQMVDGVPTRLYVNTEKLLNDREEVDADGNPLYVQVYDPTANDGAGGMVNSEERLVTKGLKSQWLAQTKENANKALAPTDWYVIRKAERDVAIPDDVVTARAAIISECTAKEAAISAATTLEEFISAIS